jgi:hypothetical protein
MSQQEPNRKIGEAKETEGFARKDGDGREVDFRVGANRLTRSVEVFYLALT